MCIAVQLAVLPPKRRLSGLFFTSFIDCNVRAYQNLNSPLRQAVKQAGKEAGGGFFANEVHFRANLEDLRISHKRLFLPPPTFCKWPRCGRLWSPVRSCCKIQIGKFYFSQNKENGSIYYNNYWFSISCTPTS